MAGLLCVMVLTLASVAVAEPTADDLLAGITASRTLPTLYGTTASRLVDKALIRLVTKTPEDPGALPPPWEAASPTYLPELSINRHAPPKLFKFVVWRGAF